MTKNWKDLYKQGKKRNKTLVDYIDTLEDED